MEPSLISYFETFGERFITYTELVFKLQFSNEIAVAVQKKEIKDYFLFLSILENHRKRGHIKNFQLLNLHEFEKLEPEFLKDFVSTLEQKTERIGRYFLIEKPDYSIRIPMAQLIVEIEKLSLVREEEILSMEQKEIWFLPWG